MPDVNRPIVVSLRFPCFIGISAGFGVLEPLNAPFVLFRHENGLFRLPKHYILFGKWPILKTKILSEWKKKTAKRTNGSIFTHVRGGGGLPPVMDGERFSYPEILHEPTVKYSKP